MNTLASSLALCTFASLVVGCISDDSEPSFPSSCAEIAAADASAVDGDYTLFIQNDPGLEWNAYCADMTSDPREFLTLEASNTSMYAAGTISVGTSVVTEFERVRIDPITLMVDVADQTFATSTGSLSHKGGAMVTSVPFAVAMTCGGLATATIDLSGTPFRMTVGFPIVGSNMTASSSLSPDRKSMTLSIDGGCGWMAPEKVNPMNAGAAGLYLAYFPGN
jgi:hypothetical protein